MSSHEKSQKRGSSALSVACARLHVLPRELPCGQSSPSAARLIVQALRSCAPSTAVTGPRSLMACTGQAAVNCTARPHNPGFTPEVLI